MPCYVETLVPCLETIWLLIKEFLFEHLVIVISYFFIGATIIFIEAPSKSERAVYVVPRNFLSMTRFQRIPFIRAFVATPAK